MPRFSAVVPLLLLALAPVRARAEPVPVPLRTISVTGEAVVHTAPDQIVIRLAVESSGPDSALSRILADTDARASRVRAIATSFKIPPEHIQTDSITLQPRYTNNKPDGYTAQRDIVLCSKDLGRVNELLTELVKAGVNRIGSISFETSQLRKFRDTARVQAVRAAREKAQLLAGELSARIGRPLSISEGSPPVQHAGGMYVQNVAVEGTGGGGGEGGFAPGQIAINAHVSVVFSLE